MQCIDRLTPVFVSQTGTGAAQSLAHGQNAVPHLVQVTMRDSSKAYTLGTHTTSNVVITVDNNAVYDLVVWFRGV